MNKKNKTVTHELVSDEKGTYVSEVQNFNKPEDYEDAFKNYYPRNDLKS
ncbi:hypothetical protein [Clostridium chauvoei]|uniref:Uncharacterized protein n=2 Tax=Clostridium chauvoei TaxID=46867 RepID=S6EJS4_9CLOT|nr:hypothetical protein [Clostridium chauvoei]MBX7281179.1 hypothetical protein [Clostridium chauvoei]MBX7283645.1 hypothetical protein [Clostridium chauvoei]MBX7286253.1 hypothetical protein [Clostridium chauvoei]MBX7288616.1 hypothetical protein [Clostridium chauvoei]MBX7291264.1 hypothetical protein [Clostridium chauvoei]